jgi:hypothetical protein
VNTLRMTTVLNGANDNCGFLVNNIKLTKVKSSTKDLINSTFMNDFVVIMSQIPGSRAILTDLMSFFVNLDRLQFYYFDNRNYSQYSHTLLDKINNLNDLKGLFFRNIIEHINPEVANSIDSFFSSIDYKKGFTPNIILDRDEDGRGFISNCYPFLVYNLPGTVITYVALFIVFKLV